jgi:hypothetical protein
MHTSIPLKYICHCILACTAFDLGMDYAIIQQSTIVYKQGYTSYTPASGTSIETVFYVTLSRLKVTGVKW